MNKNGLTRRSFLGAGSQILSKTPPSISVMLYLRCGGSIQCMERFGREAGASSRLDLLTERLASREFRWRFVAIMAIQTFHVNCNLDRWFKWFKRFRVKRFKTIRSRSAALYASCHSPKHLGIYILLSRSINRLLQIEPWPKRIAATQGWASKLVWITHSVPFCSPAYVRLPRKHPDFRSYSHCQTDSRFTQVGWQQEITAFIVIC